MSPGAGQTSVQGVTSMPTHCQVPPEQVQRFIAPVLHAIGLGFATLQT
jgi:hypothetical protein